MLTVALYWRVKTEILQVITNGIIQTKLFTGYIIKFLTINRGSQNFQKLDQKITDNVVL